MAEFQEVIRQFKRYFKANYNDEGRFYIYVEVLDGGSHIRRHSFTDMKGFEERFMKWAKEHPEPRFPTWREWQESTFGNVKTEINPCMFMEAPDWERISGIFCDCCSCCAEMSIPADIAEKLGIKPIGGERE